jgi:hypothetical protein
LKGLGHFWREQNLSTRSARAHLSMSCSFQGLVYILGVAQLIIVSACVFLYPPANVQLFAFTPHIVNGTILGEHGWIHTLHTGLAGLFIVASLLIALFVSTTFSLLDSGVFQNHAAYSLESLQQTGLWDPLFWVIVCVVHLIVVMAACTPMDIFASILSAFLFTHSLSELCSPLEPERAPSLVNFSLVGYMTALVVAVLCIPEGYSSRYVILFFVVLLDYFLGVGHTWDRAPTLETIANCRLFWSCCAALCLGVLYGAWNDVLLFSTGIPVFG